jgi:hypothetical protein
MRYQLWMYHNHMVVVSLGYSVPSTNKMVNIASVATYHRVPEERAPGHLHNWSQTHAVTIRADSIRATQAV